MLKGIKSIKATQPQKFKNVATTFFKEIESVYNVPLYNTESH